MFDQAIREAEGTFTLAYSDRIDALAGVRVIVGDHIDFAHV